MKSSQDCFQNYEVAREVTHPPTKRGTVLTFRTRVPKLPTDPAALKQEQQRAISALLDACVSAGLFNC